MITNLQVSNLRAFDGDGWDVKLSPLTVFCGTNSAGKSTLIKVLPLLRQSQGIRESFGGANGRLRSVGSQVDLGDYRSLVSHNDDTREVRLGITAQGEMPQQMYAFLSSESSDSSKHNEVVPCTVGTSFHFAGGEAGPRGDVADVAETPIRPDESTEHGGTLSRAEFNLEVLGESVLSWHYIRTAASDSSSLSYEFCLPRAYFEKAGGAKLMQTEGEDLHGNVILTTVLRGLVPGSIVAQWNKRRKPPRRSIGKSWSVFPVPPLVEFANEQFTGALRDLYYIGPLRAPAKRFYVAEQVGGMMDTRGEFLPQLLKDRSFQEQSVRAFLPGSREPGNYSLLVAINAWMRYFRTGSQELDSVLEEFLVSTTKNVLVEFQLRGIADEMHSLADSGFGYSQLLPILVAGLLAGRGATVIVEQPELHLNPALQVRLAEFIVSMVKVEKQIVIETHSEHIVNAIRVLVAESDTERLAEKCSLYFIGTSGSLPVIHNLGVASNGTIPNWPPEFFGEAAHLAGRLLRAQRRLTAR